MGRKLVIVMTEAFRTEHYAYRTEESYVYWIKRFISFHGNKHPRELGADEIQQFLSNLAIQYCVAASTQNQALSTILFLYKKVLCIDLPWMEEVTRARRSKRIPVVMTRAEVARVLACLEGRYWLMASLLYGSGLRMIECLRLRVQDLDFEYLQLSVRGGKGNKDRFTVLPERLIPGLESQLDDVRRLMKKDIELGKNGVSLPYAIDRKYRAASNSWKWQYLFPSGKYAYINHNQSRRRHHSHTSGLSRAVKAAVEASGINKRATTHTFRHSFATHVLKRGGNAVRSPLDV